MAQPKFISDDVSSLTEALATRIRETRREANLTQTELARRLRVSHRTIQEWEAGKSWPRPSARRKLDRFFAQHAEKRAKAAV